MELFKKNYVFVPYDEVEETLFEYSKYNCSFFYPILFPSKNIKSVKYYNDYKIDYDLNTIRKYNLFYSLLYIVNKHILKKYTHINKEKNLLVKTDEIDALQEDKYITIDDAIKAKILPLRYYALKYIKHNKTVEYKNLEDDALIKLINSLIFFGNFLGILSSSFHNNKDQIPMTLISNTIFPDQDFLSLSVTVQLRVFIDWINKKTIIITGSPGIGKSSQIPKLLFYISLLFDGYTDYTIFNSDDYKPEKKILLALPRILLVDSVGIGLMNTLKLSITNNQLIKLQYRKIHEKKELNNPTTEYKLLIATSQSLFRFITECFKNYSYIDIKGPCRYKITSINLDKINKNNMSKEIVCDIVIEVVDKYVHNLTKPGENTIIFLPAVSWLELLQTKLIYKDIEILLLHRKAKNYDTEVIKYIETHKEKRHIILSTPIAESSITIKGLKLVIDSGLFVNTNYKILNTDIISYWSYIQRKGRVGRDLDGYYISLFNINNLSKVLIRTIDGTRLFNTILQMYHYLSQVLERDITKKDILDNYVFPPMDIQRIYDVYDYLSNKNFTNIKYTSLLVVSGLSCSIIDYLYIYEKYNKTKIFDELKEYEEDTELKYELSNTLFKELYALNKKIYYTNGKAYYMFFNDQAKYYGIKDNDHLINNKLYKIIKYNTILIRDI